MRPRVERRVRAATAITLVAALFTVQLDGCAASGTGGDRIASPRGYEPARSVRIVSVPRGTRLTLLLRDGSAVVGLYQGTRRSADSVYAARLAEFRAARTDSAPIPEPGSVLLVRRDSERDRSARLVGFGFRSLELRWNDRGGRKEVPFESFATVTDSSGRTWTSDSLTVEAVTGRLPMSTELVLATDSGERSVPVDQVRQVEYTGADGRVNVGQVIGITVVAVVVAVVVTLAIVGWAVHDAFDRCGSNTYRVQ